MSSDPRDVLPHHRGAYRCGWGEDTCTATEIFTAWIRDLRTGRAKAVWGCADHLALEVEAILYHLRREPPADL
jgi:hypothetical protein